MGRARMAVLAAAVCAWACNDATSSGPVGINGSHDLALAGDLLFVTATDANELRVFDVVTEEPVRAPNPLHPLSIPVVDRPVELVRDTVWADGQETGGNWVYALSANARQISVVAAANVEGGLVERARIEARSNEQITAIAARGAGPDADSTLFVATYDTLRREAFIRPVTVPAPGALAARWNTPCADDPSRVCRDLTEGSILLPVSCASVASLLVMPDPDELAYALRPTVDVNSMEAQMQCGAGSIGFMVGAASPGQGPTFLGTRLLDTVAKTHTVLQFGSPVRHLFTHSAYADQRNEAARIFGVLDESSCLFPGSPCRGILAVVGPPPPVTGEGKDYVVRPRVPGSCGESVGALACDVTGYPMKPVATSQSLIMGAATGLAGPNVDPQAVALGVSQLSGVATLSDGALHFWDAEHLRDFDVNLSGPTTEEPFMITGAGGAISPRVGGPDEISLASGAVRDEQVLISYRANIPGATRITLPAAAGLTVTVPVRAEFFDVGDEVLVNAEHGCAAQGPWVVSTVAAVPGGAELTVTDPPMMPLGALPTAPCTFTVRPGESARPWIAYATVNGFLGRFSAPMDPAARVDLPADPAARPGYYYYRPYFEPGNPANFDPNRPFISFEFVDPFTQMGFPADLTGEKRIGVAYVLNLNDQFEPFRVGVSSGRTTVAGDVVFRPQSSVMEVAFPSGDLVLQIDARAATYGTSIQRFVTFQ